MELYDLSSDPGEATDLAGSHPEVVKRIEDVMAAAYVPSKRYPLGQVYRGQSKWVEENARH